MMENRLAKCDKCHRLFFDWYVKNDSEAICITVPSSQGKCSCNERWHFIQFYKKVPKVELISEWSSQ